ncbi:MAG: transglycosylase domain-containing protein, partial [Angelakisella sp.]
TNGVQAAANLYFSKDVSELHVAEMASIIGITKSPTYYNPYLTKDNNEAGIEGFENNQKRKEDILFLMHEQGKLSDQEYKEALEYEVVFDKDNNQRRVEGQQSYFVDYMMEQVINDLSKTLEISYAEAQQRMFRGGYRIYSTVDTSVQTKLETIYENPEEYMPKVSNKDEYPQSSFIITDPTGAIKGLVGGIGEKEGARVWNRATDTKRQPGSTIKPISSYALAIENDLVHWSSLLLDGPYRLVIPDQPDWTPRNYYGAPKGYMILEEALQRSTNLIPVRLVEMLSPKTVWNFLHDTLGMTSLVESDKSPSPMSLGALTDGVTPLEMAGAYQMYANGGTYTPPYTYTKVLDSKGNVVLERNTTPTRVISFDTATIVNKLMQRVVTGPYGTGS